MFETTKTPMIKNDITKEDQKKIIEKHFKIIMETLGLDLKDDSLTETPKRVAKMYVDEIFSGLREENFPKITCVENKFKYDEMIIETNIDMASSCEHHFVPIIGKIHIAYIPGQKVIGLSKMNRIAKYYCKRPQIQERLTQQIAECMINLLQTKSVAVVIDGMHLCVRTRGIEDTSSVTRTSFLSGVFRNQCPRDEFLNSLPKASELKL